MKIKAKLIFKENTYWIGVIVFGAILGFSLQFAEAWVSPDQLPPNSNISSPSSSGTGTHTRSNGCSWIQGPCTGANAWVHGSSQAICPDGKYVNGIKTTLCGMGNNSNDYSISVNIKTDAFCCNFTTGGGLLGDGTTANTQNDCTIAGGTIEDADDGKKICKFAGATCPSNWTQYGNYSATSAKTCDKYNTTLDFWGTPYTAAVLESYGLQLCGGEIPAPLICTTGFYWVGMDFFTNTAPCGSPTCLTDSFWGGCYPDPTVLSNFSDPQYCTTGSHSFSNTTIESCETTIGYVTSYEGITACNLPDNTPCTAQKTAVGCF